MMFTTNLALKVDPIYREITMRWLDHPEELEDAFARAWFKLTHRDMGPTSRYLAADGPSQQFIWQDPIPTVDYTLVDASDVARLKREILSSGLSTAELVRTAWASASTYRGTDMHGGANGARIRLATQKSWAANDLAELDRVLGVLTSTAPRATTSASPWRIPSFSAVLLPSSRRPVARAAVTVPFLSGRNDATQDQTDVESFAVLEPTADGFRNYFATARSSRSRTEMLVEKAAQ